MAMMDQQHEVDQDIEHHVPEWTLGERLAKARKDAGFTQRELAKRLHVSAGAVARWESDTGRPRDLLATIEDWERVTGVPRWWLLDVRTGSFSPLDDDRPDLEVLVNPDMPEPTELPFGQDVNERHLEPV